MRDKKEGDFAMNLNGNGHAAADDLLITDSSAITHYRLAQLLNRGLVGDCMWALQKLPEESVDMVFLAPSYFLQLPHLCWCSGTLKWQ